jgi:hypothetical protein
VLSEVDYVVPDSRSFEDVVDVALNVHEDLGWVLYKDGTMHVVRADDFATVSGSFKPAAPYKLGMLRGMAVRSGRFYTWWMGAGGYGRVAIGNTASFSAYGVKPTDMNASCTSTGIQGMAMPSNSDEERVWTLFADGSIAYGSIQDIDSLGCWPGNF